MNKTVRLHAWIRGDKTVDMCAYCKHFYVHYAYYSNSNQYAEIDSRHCCHPHVKLRFKHDVCERFERKE